MVASAQASKPSPKNQLAETRSELISATEAYKESAQEVVKFQEQEVENATAKTEQLRQLVADGLIARNELAAAEQQIEAAKSKLESTKKQIADSDNLIAQIMDAEKSEKALAKAQAAQSRRLVQPVSMRYNGMAGWALTNISSVQQFFSGTFGRPLPISTLGQSATHNAMRWDHRNSADVGVHPDSAEGRALICIPAKQRNSVSRVSRRDTRRLHRSAYSYRLSIRPPRITTSPMSKVQCPRSVFG